MNADKEATTSDSVSKTEHLNKVSSNSVNPMGSGGNNRAIQPLNDRKIYRLEGVHDYQNDSATAVMASAAALAAVSFLAF